MTATTISGRSRTGNSAPLAEPANAVQIFLPQEPTVEEGGVGPAHQDEGQRHQNEQHQRSAKREWPRVGSSVREDEEDREDPGKDEAQEHQGAAQGAELSLAGRAERDQGDRKGDASER